MLELGGNIYFTAKLGATDGHSFQHIAAIMTGSTQEDYAKMMLGGGRRSRAIAARPVSTPASPRRARRPKPRKLEIQETPRPRSK